uniref:Threonyl-tRNA synthetase n=1 Tax=Salix viminalis TaxID=40686 RepID=A0A6N2M3B6_SALVM
MQLGALTGLTRVRRFQQDDAHIFCRKSQFNEGDGAFYGPKIDISISDALKEISVCHIAARLPASRSY